MKKLLLFLLVLVSTSSIIAQDLSGKWSGQINIQGIRIWVTFNIENSDNGYNATMDISDQGVKDIPVKITVKNPALTFTIPTAGISYEGVLKDSIIVGTFNQNNQDFPLNLSKQQIEEKVNLRPQEPTLPYPYNSENVFFENIEADITLAGTLTYPKDEGIFPVVVLISGSGPQNRDEELMGHKPFLVLSDYLTRNGIAVLRFDDRGVGESDGDFNSATTADFATDVESAITYLKTRKEIDKNNIGLIGHSEGGLIAPMVAAASIDVDFIVLMAGSGIRGDSLLLLQQNLIEKALGTSDAEIMDILHLNSNIFEIIENAENDKDLDLQLRAMMNKALEGEFTAIIPEEMTKEEFIASQFNLFTSPWVKYFLRYDPSKTLEKVQCPVLAINGEKDLQVPPKENLAAIKNALEKGNNSRVTTREYKDLNHLFQESDTGSPLEYSIIDQTIAPIVLKEVTEWISLQLK